MYRTDNNHGRIKQALQRVARPVYDAARLGFGVSDLITRHIDGGIVFMEVKRADVSPSGRRLTPAEEAFRALWPDRYVVVLTEEDALRAVGIKC